MSSRPTGHGNSQKRMPRTPDQHARSPSGESNNELGKLHQKPCKFWKFGKCNWGWGCRFLHGISASDDPRRPEYRYQAVDFTAPPRSIYASQMNNMPTGNRLEDQTRVKPLRNPVVDVIPCDPTKKEEAEHLRMLMTKNNVDVLRSDGAFIFSADQIKSRESHKLADFVVHITPSSIMLYPDEITLDRANAPRVIWYRWCLRVNNISDEDLELMPKSKLEELIDKVTGYDKLTATVAHVQDETSDAIMALSIPGCQKTNQELVTLRNHIFTVFSKLNLSNSIITDKPIYSETNPLPGTIVDELPPIPDGLSYEAQRIMTFIMGTYLTQVHTCLYHINTLLGETVPVKGSSRQPTTTPSCLHPSPISSPCCDSIIRDTSERPSIDSKSYKPLEPGVAVENRMGYTLSLREQNNANNFINSPFYRY